MNKKITFIGFGEAAQNMASGFRDENAEGLVISAYARKFNDPAYKEKFLPIAEKCGVHLTGNLEEGVKDSDYILSLVNGQVAYEVGKRVIPLLNSSQLYVDLNATFPTAMHDLAEVAKQYHIPFADGAIMGPVAKFKHKIPIIVCGCDLGDFVSDMNGFGMRISQIGEKIGAASAMKLMRSIFQKGMPQLLLEFMLTAEKYGVLEQLIDSLDETLSKDGLRGMATTTFTATVIHAKRRSEEAFETVKMVQESGEQPYMIEAAAKRLETLAGVGFTKDDFDSDFVRYDQIIKMILGRRKALGQ